MFVLNNVGPAYRIMYEKPGSLIVCSVSPWENTYYQSQFCSTWPFKQYTDGF